VPSAGDCGALALGASAWLALGASALAWLLAATLAGAEMAGLDAGDDGDAALPQAARKRLAASGAPNKKERCMFRESYLS
jgi:hypothetical protein